MVEEDEPKAPTEPPKPAKSQAQGNEIPDAIKVLIQPGVELEDVGKNGVNPVEEENSPPQNLPL